MALDEAVLDTVVVAVDVPLLEAELVAVEPHVDEAVDVKLLDPEVVTVVETVVVPVEDCELVAVVLAEVISHP